MDQVSVTQTKWFETNVLPKLLKSYGNREDNVRCVIKFPENSFFLSYVCYVDLTLKKSVNNNDTEKEDTLRLVMKRPSLNDQLVVLLNVKKQFYNEILFYKQFAMGNPRFPRLVYADDSTFDDTVIVTENLNVEGFDICPEAYDIPIEYAISAVKEIGRLHGIAYVMKEQKPEKFYKIINDIQEARFVDNGWMSEYINVIATRPIEWLRRNNCTKDFCDKMEKHLGNAFNEIILESIKPVEPIATLCHGDFTRNNVFFRKIDGKLEAKLFDFALITYSSPAIDLSTFLYLNCSAKDRIEKFHEIFQSYHSTLIKHLRDSGIDDLDKYSYEKMLNDYKKRAAFGYTIAVFFFPTVCGAFAIDPETSLDDPAGQALQVRESGGEAMTEFFGKMILELRDLGSFDHVL